MTTLVFDLLGRDRSASRVLNEVGQSADRAGKRLGALGDNSAKALGTFGKALAISSVAAAATVGVHGLTTAVGAIGGAAVAASGSLLLLPGAAAAGAVAFGALKIGVSGFGAALSAIGDPEKFAEAIKALAPAAQEAAHAVAGLKPRFDELRTAVQDRLFAGLGGQITAIGATYLPILQGALSAVAGSANAAAHQVAGVVTQGSRIADVTTITGAAAGTFGHLAPALAPLVGVLLDVAAVGAPILLELTGGAQSAAERFSDFIAAARQSGQLEGWIRGGLAALSQLGQLLANIGSIVGSVFGAMQAAGGGVLGILVQLTGEARAFLSSAAGQQVLTTVFTTLRQLVDALLPGVRALGGALMSAITSIAPALPGLGAAFAAAAVSVAPLVEGLGTLAGTILPPLIAAIGFLAPALGPLAGYLGAIVLGVKAWSAAQLLLNLALTANPIGIVVVALGALIAVIALAWHHSETFRSIVIAAWEAIKSATSAVWGFITGFIRGSIDTIRGVISWLGGLPGMFASWFGAAKDTAVRKVGELVGWLGGLPGRILSALGHLGGLLIGVGWDIVRGLWNGISAGWGWLVGQVQGLARRLFVAAKAALGIGSPSKLFRDEVGRQIPEGIAVGIEGNADSARHAMARLTALLQRSISPRTLGLGGGLSESGRAAQEILDHLRRGGRVFEDFSFRGGSALAGRHNDALAGAFAASGGGDPHRFLADYIGSQRAARQVIEVRSGGSRLDELLVEMLRRAVRTQGGDVQLVLGS
ncbi:MAG: hypothetical protein ACRDRZ_03610 [Pseudonocardiaceae bacterium]